MSTFLSEQGEIIAQAKTNTQQANLHLQKGNQQLQHANEYMQKERVNRCCFLIWIVLALCALLVPVVLAILNSNGVF